MYVIRTDALQQEMDEIAAMCSHILKLKPDIIVTEKGVSGEILALS